MTTAPSNPTTALPGSPPVVDLATWQTARDELLVREKAHTREGDALAAARRRLPMVELDGTVEVVGPDGPVPFLDLFQGRDELVIYQSMWYDGAPHQGQCEGCTFNVWHMKDAVYLNARGVSFAVLTSGPWDEVASYVEFMGYTQPWYSVRGVEAPIATEEGHIVCLPARRRPRVPHLLHDGPWQRAGRRVPRPARHDALRPSRGVGGQPRGLARGAQRVLVLALGRGRRMPPGARPAAPRRSGPAPARPPWRPSAGTATTTDAPSSTALAKVLARRPPRRCATPGERAADVPPHQWRIRLERACVVQSRALRDCASSRA